MNGLREHYFVSDAVLLDDQQNWSAYDGLLRVEDEEPERIPFTRQTLTSLYRFFRLAVKLVFVGILAYRLGPVLTFSAGVTICLFAYPVAKHRIISLAGSNQMQ